MNIKSDRVACILAFVPFVIVGILLVVDLDSAKISLAYLLATLVISPVLLWMMKTIDAKR